MIFFLIVKQAFYNFEIFYCGNVIVGVQDMLRQNMVPWHIEYLKVREFGKKKQQKQRGHCDLSHLICP